MGEMATSHLPSRGPMGERNGYITLAVFGAHVWTEWLHHTCCLGGPYVGGMATAPLPSRGSMCGRNDYCYLGGPMCGWNGYLTPAVLGAHV